MTDLNRVSASKMYSFVDSNFFTLDPEEDIATPNPRYLTNEVPVYDWNETEQVFLPRTPIQEESSDA